MAGGLAAGARGTDTSDNPRRDLGTSRPEGNGCAKRFIRTLKEQLLWVEPFATVEDLRLALLAFKDRFNHEWLIQRHEHRSPGAVRTAYTAALAA